MASSNTAVETSIHVTKRTNRSLRMHLLQVLLNMFAGSITKRRDTAAAGSPKLKISKHVRKTCDVVERDVEGIRVYDLKVKRRAGDDEKDQRKRTYYFSGGGWFMPASSEHHRLCAEMACKLPNTTVSLVSYPLAPNCPAPVACPQLMRLFHSVLKQAELAGESVIFAGDSAGANIVLCLTIQALLEDEDCRCPSAILAISPSTDLTRQNPAIKQVEKHDPILRFPFINSTARDWCSDWNRADPRVSPLYAKNLQTLANRNVRIHGVTGTYDILAPDAVLFREKCNEAGIQGEWLDWDKQMHCFPLTFGFGFPEGVQAVEWMLNVLRRTP